MQSLLDRSILLEDALRGCLAPPSYAASTRSIVASSMCMLALEHGNGLRQLLGAGSPSSALALFRCQLEIVTRATWVAFAAGEDWLSRFTAPVNALKEPVPPPSMEEMLVAISSKAPRRAAQLLEELKDAAWKSLHSYVYGGVRPVAETIAGYDSEFLRKTVLNSNGLTAMAALVLAGLSSDQAVALEVVRIQHQHLDCLPPAR